MIDRRSLLKNGALASAAAAVAGRASAVAEPAASPAPETSVAAFELEEATVADLQKRMSSGADTARTLAEKYIARIEAVDRRGPTLRAVLEINPDALSIAAGLDAERKAGKVRGPLHGIPVLIKDNVGTADRMQTTAGSLALVGAIPAADAHIVKRLRDAGAVILGKTNLSEWANFRSTHASSGWSGRGGQCRNPYALDRDPSGSSSGSGAAAAANLCAVTVGTETDGSIVSPSNNCALVGFKPTLGLVSRTGIIPIAHSQDTAGPMTRTVADAAALLSAHVRLRSRRPDDARSRGQGPGGLHRVSGPQGPRGHAHRRPAQEALRPEPRGRRRGRGGARRHAARGRDHRRPGGHRDARRRRTSPSSRSCSTSSRPT